MTAQYALGFELSTQSAKSVVLDLSDGRVAYSGKVDFDSGFPAYATKGGVLASDRPDVRHTSPFLMIEVIDQVFRDLVKAGLDLSSVAAVKADAMQHCTVYAGPSFAPRLKSLSSAPDLLAGLRDAISRKTSPIWEDRSTAEEAGILTSMLSPLGGIEKLTANKAELRFPGVQVMKWARQDPAGYSATRHVLLLSAFVTSVLAGKVCPVDTGDGWGTNLNSTDIRNPGWNVRVLSAVNAWLKRSGLGPLTPKLGRMCRYDFPVGWISPYFAARYGMNPSAVVLAGTGDNPATLLGCGGGAVLSLGSSYTVNGVMEKVAPRAGQEYNIFGFASGNAMALSCVTNGGKLHETFLRRYVDGAGSGQISKEHWRRYSELAGPAPLGADEKLILPYLMDESVPVRKAGIVREGFGEDQAPVNVRSLYVSQSLSLRLHAGHLTSVPEICVVGGGAGDSVLRQMVTDLFGCPTYTIRNPDLAAPLGCAIAAARHALKLSYARASGRFVQKDASSVMAPSGVSRTILGGLLKRYADLESKHT